MKVKQFIITILILFLIHGYIFPQFVKKHGQLKVEGTKLKDKDGNAVMLRGMSYGWHNWWPRFYNAETVKWLKEDWGCTVLRAAMGVEPDGGYIKNPLESKQLILNIVDAAIENDIYVIIDWHSHNTNLTEAKTFFTEMAKLYKEFPNVIYEIYNEPDDETWKDVKAYSIEIISAIRAIDPDNIILVGNPHWDQDVNVVADDPITGFSNIMYTLHFYSATHKKWLRDRGDYAIKKGIPLFVSEFGITEASGTGSFDFVEWKNWLNWMENNQISWINWSIADKNELCSVLKPGAGSEGGWTESNLTEAGIYMRKEILAFKGTDTKTQIAKNNHVSDFKVFPNPTKEFLNIEANNINEFKNCNFSIYDMQGKKINTKKEISDKILKVIPSEKLADGMYIIKIERDNSIITESTFMIK